MPEAGELNCIIVADRLGGLQPMGAATWLINLPSVLW